jgi:hypothetical protein
LPSWGGRVRDAGGLPGDRTPLAVALEEHGAVAVKGRLAIRGAADQAEGQRGRVQTSLGFWLPFEITDWEEGRAWAWRVGGIPATGHTVTPAGPDACRVTFTIPAWAPFYVPVCRAALRKLNDLAGDLPA